MGEDGEIHSNMISSDVVADVDKGVWAVLSDHSMETKTAERYVKLRRRVRRPPSVSLL